MRQIRLEDIKELNGSIMELPAFSSLGSKDALQEILDIFMNDMYIKNTQEQFDAMNFIPSKDIQTLFFSNYGIDKKYSNALKSTVKNDLVYQLEKLFQNKGSTEVFKIFAGLFKNIFRNMNFYTVVVYKKPNAGSFIYEYGLEPLLINDTDNIITVPEIDITQTRKYLMHLDNFKDYRVWPVSTNLVYTQVTLGQEIGNNMNVFLDGIRAYSSTFLQGTFSTYTNSASYTEVVYTPDVELLVNYFKMETARLNNPDWKFGETIYSSSYLAYDPNFEADPLHPNYNEHLDWTTSRDDFLSNMQTLLYAYGDSDSSDRVAQEALRRRWQMFLKLKETDTRCYSTYDELNAVIKRKYPLIQEDFLNALHSITEDTEPLFDFYTYLYSMFLNSAANIVSPLNNQWTLDYIDILFGSLFSDTDFTEWYFNPVMDLFIRYFFPIEMEYLNDLIDKVQVRDKRNAVSYESRATFEITAGFRSLLPMPVYGLDYQRFRLTSQENTNVDINTRHIIEISSLYKDAVNVMDSVGSSPIRAQRDALNISDSIKSVITRGTQVIQSARGCFKSARTKEYLEEVLNTYLLP